MAKKSQKNGGENDVRRILIDWLSVTWKADSILPEFASNEEWFAMVSDLLGVALPWEKGFPRYGYQLAYHVAGRIRFMCGRDGYECFLDLTGEGCRMLESFAAPFDWFCFIQRLSALPLFHCSRLDVACDTFGTLPMAQIIQYSLTARYVSRWKLPPRVVQGREETVDFGSPSSRTMLRIYNKTLERLVALGPGVDVPSGWVRVELQTRNEGAMAFLREWEACGDLGQVYFGIVRNQLRFVRFTGDSNYSRLPPVQWWARFLGNSPRLKLAYPGALEYNLDTLENYVVKQSGSSILTYLAVHGGDVSRLLDSVGGCRLNPRQKVLLDKLGIDVL